MDTVPEKSKSPRSTMRIAVKAVKWLAVAAIIGVVLFVLVNLRDEALTPEAKALAEFQPPVVTERQNAYLALVGFAAPAGTDSISEGAKIVADSDAAVRRDPMGVERIAQRKEQPPSTHSDNGLRFVGNLDTLCDPLSKPCLPSQLDANALQVAMAANAELVARYLALQDLPVFANTSVPDMLQWTQTGDWAATRRLLLTRMAMDVQSGQDGHALAFLSADMALWRRALASGGSLVDEMIAVRMLTSGMALLSEFIAMPEFDVQTRRVELQRMLAPLSPVERNAAPVFHREYAVSAKFTTLHHQDAIDSKDIAWWNQSQMSLLYKLNASLNSTAAYFGELQSLASHPPAEFAARNAILDRRAHDMASPGVTWLYNPIGKTLVGIAMPAYSEFIARVFDASAYVQLVRAQLEVRLANLASDNVPDFLASAGVEMRNPYDNQPFEWDAATRSLTFEPRSKRFLTEWKLKVVVPPSSGAAAR